MCQEGTTGADYMIPVVKPGSEVREEVMKLGKCMSAWTVEQEEAASKGLSYLIIQTKARQRPTERLRIKALKNCSPLDKTVSLHSNFINHTRQNPFLSILLELGCDVRRGQKSVQVHWIRSYFCEKRDRPLKKRKINTKRKKQK